MCPCHGGSLTWHSCLGAGSHPLHSHCPSVVPGYVYRVSSIELASETCKVRHGRGPMGAGSWWRDDRCQSPLSARHQHHQPGTPSPQPAGGLYRNEKWIELYFNTFLWGKFKLHILIRFFILVNNFTIILNNIHCFFIYHLFFRFSCNSWTDVYPPAMAPPEIWPVSPFPLPSL